MTTFRRGKTRTSEKGSSLRSRTVRVDVVGGEMSGGWWWRWWLGGGSVDGDAGKMVEWYIVVESMCRQRIQNDTEDWRGVAGSYRCQEVGFVRDSRQDK